MSAKRITCLLLYQHWDILKCHKYPFSSARIKHLFKVYFYEDAFNYNSFFHNMLAQRDASAEMIIFSEQCLEGWLYWWCLYILRAGILIYECLQYTNVSYISHTQRVPQTHQSFIHMFPFYNSEHKRSPLVRSHEWQITSYIPSLRPDLSFIKRICSGCIKDITKSTCQAMEGESFGRVLQG